MIEPGFDMGERHDPNESGSKVDYPRMKEGGLDAIFFAAFLYALPATLNWNIPFPGVNYLVTLNPLFVLSVALFLPGSSVFCVLRPSDTVRCRHFCG